MYSLKYIDTSIFYNTFRKYSRPCIYMIIQTPLELSAIVRQARKQAGLTQEQLAERIGVRRLWVVRFENGKAEVELGAVMRALRALGVALDVSLAGVRGIHEPAAGLPDRQPTVDLDALLAGEHGE